MSEEKNTLKIIDGTLKAVEDNLKQFKDVLLTAKSELIELEKDKTLLSNKKNLLEKEKEQLESDKSKLEAEKIQSETEKERLKKETTQLESDKTLLEKEKAELESEKAQLEKEKTELEIEKNQLEDDKRQLENEKKQLEQDKKILEKEKEERDEKIGAMTQEQMRLLDEYESLKVELNKFAKTAEESQEAEFNFERIKALLSIYTVLIEKIWQGQPHYRILFTLHGSKEEMSREELKMTTGIEGAMVLRAVQELDKVDLIEYNIDTSKAKLKTRLFPKKTIEEKSS
jgi:chromosome segregation ATPase